MAFIDEIGWDGGMQKGAAEGKRAMSNDEKVSIEVPRNIPSTKANGRPVILPVRYGNARKVRGINNGRRGRKARGLVELITIGEGSQVLHLV